ncbi:hypothetical protein BU15DRAFT_62773 [Melanogaster broomeanus]|nr:hypothetical protein BU15DRAFT_62773 [Melanogaster broomeanus]
MFDTITYYTSQTVFTTALVPLGERQRLENKLGGMYKRATGMALQLTVGSVGGAIASNTYQSQDAPRYIFGSGPCRRLCLWVVGIKLGKDFSQLGSGGLIAILTTVLAYKRINAARECDELLQQQEEEKAGKL